MSGVTSDEWDAARRNAGIPIRCSACGGEGVIGGLVVDNGPTVDETCGRCGGHGYLKGEQHAAQ